jgi:iron-sulfur cluster repair protein YtfE (RIC family)
VPSSGKSQSAERLLAEDHEALDKLLTALLAALDEGDAAKAFARLDLFWARLAMHIRAEHLHLFPGILEALDGGTLKGGDETLTSAEAREAIAQLHDDHDFFMHELAGAIKLMRDCRTTGGGDPASKIEGVRQTLATVRNRLEAHNKLEEELVYRLPAKLFGPEEQNALGVEIRDELKNLPPRFRNEAGDD